MNENALQVFQPKSISEATTMAEMLARSTLLPDALRGKPGDVLVTIITGQELGLTAMQAIRGMHVVKGKAILSADLAVALVKKHPDCVYFKLEKSTDEVATYATERKGEGKTEMSFTIAQARNAGLAGDNWKKYPAAMLRARAASALARAVYPDMMLGVYDEDEVREVAARPEEKDVTPPADPVKAQSQKLKEAIKSKAASKIIDVKPGETDAQAEQRAAFDFTGLHFDELNKRIGDMEAWLKKGPKDKAKVDEGQLKLAALQAELATRETRDEPPPIGEEYGEPGSAG